MVTVGGKDYTVTGKSGEMATVTLTGLTKETTYSYSAVAKNAAGKVSEATFTALNPNLVMSDGETSAKTFKLTLSDATGIRDLDDDALNTIFYVYGIGGKVVSRNANRASLLHLPAGVYVVKGKKVVVK